MKSTLIPCEKSAVTTYPPGKSGPPVYPGKSLPPAPNHATRSPPPSGKYPPPPHRVWVRVPPLPCRSSLARSTHEACLSAVLPPHCRSSFASRRPAFEAQHFPWTRARKTKHKPESRSEEHTSELQSQSK